MQDPLQVIERAVTIETRGFNKLDSAAFLELVRDDMDEIIIGIDEVGRGPVFGPMVVAGCANVTGWRLSNVQDSKKIKSEEKRKSLANEIRHNCIFTIATVSPAVINYHGTLNSLMAAFNLVIRQSIQRVRTAFPNTKIKVICDGRDVTSRVEDGCQVVSMEKADATVYEVSCASIVAKSRHDDLIAELAANPVYAKYEILSHKGYATPKHKQLVLQHGFSDLHRTAACTTWLFGVSSDVPCSTPVQQAKSIRPSPTAKLAPSQRRTG